jgi:hypothetical protein
MPEDNQSTIEINGKTYQYDYDYDIYYRTYTQEPETPRERWIKVVVALTLLTGIMAFARAYLHP